jgi:hypothetical protein
MNTRRDFIRSAAALTIGGLSMRNLLEASQTRTDAAAAAPLDLAEWSYFWVGVEQAHLARGTTANGKQMYVEY